MKQFMEITPEEIEENVFQLISKDWMLVTAKDSDRINTMTASWGGLGEMWGKHVSYIVIRPSRYTFSLLEHTDYYTLSFFDEKYRDILNYCGKYSGRDKDKIKETNLTVLEDGQSAYFSQAKLVLVCKKLYGQMFDPSNFVDSEFGKKMYPNDDIHKLMIGSIEKVLVAK